MSKKDESAIVQFFEGKINLTFEDWLISNGIVMSSVSKDDLSKLRTYYDNYMKDMRPLVTQLKEAFND